MLKNWERKGSRGEYKRENELVEGFWKWNWKGKCRQWSLEVCSTDKQKRWVSFCLFVFFFCVFFVFCVGFFGFYFLGGVEEGAREENFGAHGPRQPSALFSTIHFFLWFNFPDFM